MRLQWTCERNKCGKSAREAINIHLTVTKEQGVVMAPDSTLQILQENLAWKRSVGRERKPVGWGKARITDE